MEVKKNADLVERMLKKQPPSIIIDGVEIPSYQCMWEKFCEVEIKLSRQRKAIMILGAAITLVALKLLLR